MENNIEKYHFSCQQGQSLALARSGLSHPMAIDNARLSTGGERMAFGLNKNRQTYDNVMSAFYLWNTASNPFIFCCSVWLKAYAVNGTRSTTWSWPDFFITN